MAEVDDSQDFFKARRMARKLMEKTPINKPGEEFGLCSNCNSFTYTEFEFGEVFALCGTMASRRSPNRKVRKCSNYVKKTFLGIRDMWEIATLVDIKPKNKIGFAPRDEKEVEFRKGSELDEEYYD